MLKHSKRAKKNMRAQINAQIRFMEGNIAAKKKEHEKAMRYKKYKLPGFGTQVNRIKAGILKAQNDLKMIRARKAKMEKEGKI